MPGTREQQVLQPLLQYGRNTNALSVRARSMRRAQRQQNDSL